MPVVLVNRSVDDLTVSSVTGDDHLGIRLAVEHLVALGHRRIAHVAGPQHLSTGLARHHGFVDSMQQSGLEVDPDLVAYAETFREPAGAAAFRTILDHGADVTAVVAANDLIALGCYDVLNERGLTVGTDLSVVGFNNMLFADKLCPPLTTIAIPHYEIGARSGRMVLDIVEGRTTEPVQLHLEPEIVVRVSTGPPLDDG
jgi:LacI family transcriptional regulator